MLAISLLLFSVRHIISKASWSDTLLKWSFWGLNGGLAAMVVFSLIPSGFYQLWYAVKYGLWYARSPEIASGPVIRAFSWARMVPGHYLCRWCDSAASLFGARNPDVFFPKPDRSPFSGMTVHWKNGVISSTPN